jgi:hypothetical protein
MRLIEALMLNLTCRSHLGFPEIFSLAVAIPFEPNKNIEDLANSFLIVQPQAR